MMNHVVLPLLELRESDLVPHGMAKQQEALLTYAQMSDYAGIYELYSQAVGSAVLVPSWEGEAYRYYLMTRLSEVQWVQREGEDAIVLWDFRNEVVVILRGQDGYLVTRVLSNTVQCEEATPIGEVS
ncbi:MAG: hypothetical protein HPY54_09655 [Chthonomonadetes bacterium]|jgi:hypothetical protein|nr:hypothetical protein [Chthonomonadetes bacterium]